MFKDTHFKDIISGGWFRNFGKKQGEKFVSAGSVFNKRFVFPIKI